MFLEAALSRLVQIGTLIVTFPDGRTRQFGTGCGPTASMSITTRSAMRRLFFNPALALGETYMSEELVPGDEGLYQLLDVISLNVMSGGGHPMDTFREHLRAWHRRIDQFNPMSRAQRNVAHHYDLDARLYALMLDSDRQYSCAYFPRGDETLDQAQLKKKIHIASKLYLDRPDLDVLDIGCGWGGMALYLAREHGARVTGLTLSAEQLRIARERARQAGLEDRVSFEMIDYRNWNRPVDRIVSIGMFEHVGIDHYKRFFGMVRSTLKPDGVALIHAIGRSDGPGSTNPWVAKYIFPGGYSPAVSEVLSVVEKSGLWATDIEILRLHYAETLAHWRRRFLAHREELAAMYDERFCRMFEFYLAGSEIAFRRLGHMNWQLQLTRDVATLPLARDYMIEAERTTAAKSAVAA